MVFQNMFLITKQLLFINYLVLGNHRLNRLLQKINIPRLNNKINRDQNAEKCWKK